MKLKQSKTIDTIKWFIPESIKTWLKATTGDAEIGILNVIQSRKGVSAEEAFFLKTERGIMPAKVKSKTQLRKLLWGHKRMAMHEKMWKEGMIEHTLFEWDFKSEPEYIQKIARSIWEGLKTNLINRI